MAGRPCHVCRFLRTLFIGRGAFKMLTIRETLHRFDAIVQELPARSPPCRNSFVKVGLGSAAVSEREVGSRWPVGSTAVGRSTTCEQPKRDIETHDSEKTSRSDKEIDYDQVASGGATYKSGPSLNADPLSRLSPAAALGQNQGRWAPQGAVANSRGKGGKNQAPRRGAASKGQGKWNGGNSKSKGKSKGK